MDKFEAIRTRLFQLIERTEEIDKKAWQTNGVYKKWKVNSDDFKSIQSSSLSIIGKIFNKEHSYYQTIANLEGSYKVNNRTINKVLQSIQEEIDQGLLISVEDLVSADIFSDFLEMADYLLADGYKDAAAVITGSTLEKHLKTLCDKHAIPTTKEGKKPGKLIFLKASLLNDDLKKGNPEPVYGNTDHSHINAWLKIRNSAAHGKYDEYSKGQVENMLSGVKEFIGRVKK